MTREITILSRDNGVSTEFNASKHSLTHAAEYLAQMSKFFGKPETREYPNGVNFDYPERANTEAAPTQLQVVINGATLAELRAEARKLAQAEPELETCGRCGGSGVYIWGAIVNGVPSNSGICFRCGGEGKVHPKVNERGERGRGEYAMREWAAEISAVDTAAETEEIAQLVQVEVADDVEIGAGFDDHAAVATESDPAIPFGTYTLELMDGEHFTFRVVAGKNQLDGKIIVEYLAGPDNDSDFVGFAFMSGPYVNVWKRFRDGVLATRARQLQTMMQRPDELEDAGVRYALASGRCRRCNRKLTVPASIHRGYGPDCAGMVGVA